MINAILYFKPGHRESEEALSEIEKIVEETGMNIEKKEVNDINPHDALIHNAPYAIPALYIGDVPCEKEDRKFCLPIYVIGAKEIRQWCEKRRKEFEKYVRLAYLPSSLLLD